MGTETKLTGIGNLTLYKPDPFSYGQPAQQPEPPKDPNEWFVQRYPYAYQMHGSPFLLLHEPGNDTYKPIMPVTLNMPFFAQILGGRRDLGHHVIYFEAECSWYFKDCDGLYKITTSDKLINLYMALMMKCAQDMPNNIKNLNLVHEWRSDKVCKAIITRAKSVLVADSTFFSASSPHQRVKGPEIHERLLMKYVSEALSSEPGNLVMLKDAYEAYCRLVKRKELVPVKRSDFTAMVVPVIKDQFNVSLRNDLVVDGKSGQRGWKNVRLQAGPV